MKNSKRAAVLSLLAIVFTLGVTSCGKANLKNDLEGSWTIVNITQDGEDVYAQIGASISGTFFFNKKAKKCTVSFTISSPGNPDDSQTGDWTYKVKNKETIILQGETYTVEVSTNNTLVLSQTSNGVGFNWNFTK